ncbi:MAG: Asp-tRNA(Asn)/Glu-tRNA(Gln) amidotransferase subunit GatC [Clostridia bacterium]|nr:Asp-tRNA(Asn)/Glu-tRNA(Gln) amidotransferase subunit GatC [Clostridia bacterium]MBQ4575770.1 Asp-tRNA(Asn)/Glu-tRNA(Gln) amidotransferase subunit GatC [Clostridia bacterium]
MKRRIDIKHIASLAKLSFDDQETAILEKNFESILDFAGELPILVDADDMSDVLELDKLRDDHISAGISVDILLKQAPSSLNGFISVPKVIEN